MFSPNSRGANKLIRDSGAKLACDHKDVLEELNLSAVEQQIEMTAFFPQDGHESDVLTQVTYDPVHIDEIIRSSGLEIALVSSALTLLELKGLVKQVVGMSYIKLKETSSKYEVV